VSVRIYTNIEALNAQRNLSAMGSAFARSVEKLSSGLRINRAADDAAGLAIGQKLSAQVTGLNQARRNAQDGISMVQTAEGALAEVHSMLQRIRELAVEAANSTLSSTDAASIGTEITALRDEINRIAGATNFNGQNLLTGALSVGQSGGTLAVGTSLTTGHSAAISAVDVAGAKASTTYTITSQAGGKVTLSDGTGLSQQVTLAATIGADGTTTVNFGNLGVKLTVVGDAAKTAAELATDLAATAGTLASAAGGASGADLVDGDIVRQTDTTPVLVQNVWFYPSGAIDAPPPTGVASTGVAAGTIVFSVTALGHITGSLGGEAFAGDLAAFQPNHSETIVLTGSRNNTITLNYHQSATAASLADEATDFNGSRITFVAGPGTATVSGMTVAPSAAVGTYTFTSSAPGQLTLTGPGGAQTVAVGDMAAFGTQTLDFNTLGISFTLTADGGGMSAASIVTNALQAANDTIVVTTTGSAGVPRTLSTGAGAAANFQIGANAGDSLGVSFADARTTAAGYGSFDAAITAFQTATGSGTGIISAAQALITSSDSAIGYVSTTRGNLGAVQNRLEHTTASVSVASENLNASLSRIRDLDVAAEMVNFTKTQILQQAGTAILAQANQAPQNILALLR
jgi:flagellin